MAHCVAAGDPALVHDLLRLGGHDPDTDALLPGSPFVAGTARDVAAAWIHLLPHTTLDALTRLIDQTFTRAGAQSMVPVGDLPQILGELHARGIQLGLATSDNEESARMCLDVFGIRELFAFVCGWDSGHGGKPGPGMVNAFCAATGLSPAEVGVVGDSIHDLEMGRASGAGLRVGVLTGPATLESLAPHAHLVLADISQLAQLPQLRAPPPPGLSLGSAAGDERR